MRKPATKARPVVAKGTPTPPVRIAREGAEGGDAPAHLIDAKIKELNDWRGETLARPRTLIKQADPEVTEACQLRG